MPFESVSAMESHSTYIATIWSFISMCHHVSFQGKRVDEGFFAELARVWLPLLVNQFVTLEVADLRKAFSAQVAYVRSCFTVHGDLVSCQIASLRKFFVAYIAFVRLLSGMGAGVSFQCVRCRKRCIAELTVKRLLNLAAGFLLNVRHHYL